MEVVYTLIGAGTSIVRFMFGTFFVHYITPWCSVPSVYVFVAALCGSGHSPKTRINKMYVGICRVHYLLTCIICTGYARTTAGSSINTSPGCSFDNLLELTPHANLYRSLYFKTIQNQSKHRKT